MMPTLIAATDPTSGLVLIILRSRIQPIASARATYAPVIAAVRVPPSASSTSQSSRMVFSPRAL